ncbi:MULTISPECIES: ATP-binding protein [Kosmotoga]|uniref:histidine kinase n=1 Tax=Kosmotoga olearia (strain ATCC BAA-1733 / DSM 21960 / TBF 19.5.1) TaxID=521045 RepID=C5CH99_KOSOT|nr:MULTISPECIES: ATP-binding protein [Kosmotoga]ACR78738.1 multi-sensor signal transduction histidine kinase [Kosmotoga olearia TBF 19.5.1]MDI3524146.1 hypothetical protein [Kosmotoga sp.]MDK2952660.1 hypothetical protein [Kosmotoga sp.]OAA25533.1 hypothetical protein DU53_00060 [Kosmotoga sp. DU53]
MSSRLREYLAKLQNLIRKLDEVCSSDFSVFVFEKYKKRLKEFNPGRDYYVMDFPEVQELLNTKKAISKQVKLRKGDRFESKEGIFVPLIKDELIGAVAVWDTNFQLTDAFLEAVSKITDMIFLLSAVSSGAEATRRLELVKELTDVFESTYNESELLHKTIGITRKMVKARYGFYCRKFGEVFAIDSASCDVCEKEFENWSFKFSEDLLLKLGEGKVFISPKTAGEYLSIFPEDFEVRSFILVPLDVEDKIEGLIIITDRESEEAEFRPHRYLDEEDLEMVQDISNRLTVAISRIRLMETLEKEVEELNKLKKINEDLIDLQRNQLLKMSAVHKIAQSIRRPLKKDRIIKIVLLGITSSAGLNFDRAIFLEKDQTSPFIIPRYTITREIEYELSRDIPLSGIYGNFSQYLLEASNYELPYFSNFSDTRRISYSGNLLLERVVLRRKALHITPEMWKHRYEELFQLRTIIDSDDFVLIPIAGEQSVQGMLVVDNSLSGRPILSSDLEILGLLADSCGLALELSNNYERLLEMTRSLERERNLSDYYRNFVSNILQSLESSIIVCDRDGKITEMNRRAEELFGLSREKCLGVPLKTVCDQLSELHSLIAEVLKVGETVTLSDHRLEDFNDRIFDIRITPLVNKRSEEIIGIILSLDDVTERFNLEKELRFREKMAALGEMSAKVAHEIRNPITIISGFTRRIARTRDREKIQQYVEILNRELERLETIVNDVLDYSRRAKKKENIESVNALELCQEIANGFKDLAKKKGISLIVEGDEETVFVGNKNRMKQVIINLVQNAIEASEDNGIVKIEVEFAQENVRISVWNKGKEIPPEILRRVFEPFFTTKTFGTGLGLSICKRIVEEHGGNITAQSDSNGTIFVVSLPSRRYANGDEKNNDRR